MTNLKVLCKALVLLVCCFCYSSLADTTSTAQELDLSDGTITNPTGGCPSGTTAAHVNTSNWGTETVRYGECVNTFAISYAINQALSASGISVDKVHYRWRYLTCFNQPGRHCSNYIANRVNTSTGEVTDDTYWDELTVVIEITDANGTVVSTKTWNMDTWYDWNQTNDHSTNEVNVNGIRWQIHEDNIELYNHTNMVGTIYTPNALGDVRFRVTAHDGGNWDGYYGPVFNKLQTWFTYRTNPCTQTALYDASCPGYAAAYATYVYDTACTASALYDSGCPGYAAAYYTQQCTANPLYDSGCSGYASAYYNQQCSANALYDSGCTGYSDAYFAQQCGITALYNTECTGYAAAYLTQQCDISALYSSSCTGYAAAYYTQQCGISALYDSGCDGFFTASCDADPLYDFLCTGYDDAYFDQQCLYNPQYDTLCTGYVAPVTDGASIIDDGTSTGDSIIDSVIEAPALPPSVIIIPPPPMPEPMPEPEPEPAPEVIVVGPNVIEVAPVVVEPPTVIEQIEQEIEAEIEAEMEVLEQEMIVEDTVIEEEVIEEEVIEEEVIEEEVIEEETDTEDSTEDETVNEEVVEEEALEEESEESAEDDVVEEESEEETTEEVVEEEKQDEPVVAKKTKKLTKAEKQKAKEKKMREIITEKLKELAIVMGEAKSLEDQQALQQLIAALINYVPGFNAYGQMAIPGVDFYQPEDIYKDKMIPENNRGLRNGLASELLHKKMVDMQYEGMD